MSQTLSQRSLTCAARVAMSTPVAPARCLSILLYHRVLPEVDPLFPGEVHAARFDRQMALVARSFTHLPLAEAVRRLADGTLPPRALSITFDDGYADNHDVALPILRRHGLSACFFVATGFLDGGRMWNDTVIECLRRTPHNRLDLQDFGLGELPTGSTAERRQAIEQLIGLIKYQDLAARHASLQSLVQRCAPVTLPDDLMLRSSQVQALRAAGMEVGAHTVHHPILCRLADDAAEGEMASSRDRLRALLGEDVTLFAYPNGRPDQDYTARHVALARKLGFDAAVSTAAGVSTAGADAFQLPRFTPWDHADGRWLARLVARRRQRSYVTARPA